MYRKFWNKLKAWEDNSIKEPLLVVGARQVGKTYIIKKFCEKTYDDYIYINLEQQKDYISIFSDSLNPGEIIRNIELYSGRRISKGTALFIDEIQYCEEAITALKYFCEAENNYRILGAGSLLGVKLNRFSSSFPVGKVRVEHMYPMDLEEFMIACGENGLVEEIRDAYDKMRPLNQAIHNKAMRIYQDYIYTGGMPAMVCGYLNAGCDIMGEDRSILDNIRLSYLADMNKYTTSAAEGVKIAEVFESIPRQLAKPNPKFKYNEIRSGANRRDFMSSLDWLDASGMILRVRKLDDIRSPLKAYESASGEKVYLSDIGILNSMTGVRFRELLPESDNIYKGAVTENYVMQQLAFLGNKLYYYKPTESMEIDLILDTDDGSVPVEIKSGRHRSSKSLKNYIDRYDPYKAVRISANNIGRTDKLISIPLYAVFAMA